MIALLLNPGFCLAKNSCDKALEAIPKIENSKNIFEDLLNFKTNYGHCMDGGIAEGISALVVDALDKNWSEIKNLSGLFKKDSEFKKFLLISVAPNVTGQEKEVKSIIQKTKKSCPPQVRSFCKELKKACEKSLVAE